MANEYKVVTVTTGFFSGRLSASKLERSLNLHGSSGWRFSKTIHERKRWLFIFGREAHFLVFERESDGSNNPDVTPFETVASDDGGSLFIWIVIVLIVGVLVYFGMQYSK